MADLILMLVACTQLLFQQGRDYDPTRSAVSLTLYIGVLSLSGTITNIITHIVNRVNPPEPVFRLTQASERR